MGSDEVIRQLVVVAAEVEQLEKQVETAKARRDQLIMDAIAQKVPRAIVAESANLSEPMIYKIKGQMEDKARKSQ